jgi:hypothetical protein
MFTELDAVIDLVDLSVIVEDILSCLVPVIGYDPPLAANG